MPPRKWKFINRKSILDHPRLTLVEDEVELPDGKRITYLREAPVTRQSVAIVAVNQQNEMLLQREYSYPPDEIMWQLPGGSVNEDEDIIEAAKRELSEESNYSAGSCLLLGSYYTNNRRSNQKQYVVLCSDLVAHKGTSDAEEFIESQWIPLPEIDKKITSGEFTNINLLAALNLWTHSTKDR